MKKVEYLIGAFLTEFDVITHELPEERIKKPKTKKSTYQAKPTETKLKRKTEHTTKKKNKSEKIDNNE